MVFIAYLEYISFAQHPSPLCYPALSLKSYITRQLAPNIIILKLFHYDFFDFLMDFDFFWVCGQSPAYLIQWIKLFDKQLPIQYKGLFLRVIVYTGGIDVFDFLIEKFLRKTYLPNPLLQFVKIVH